MTALTPDTIAQLAKKNNVRDEIPVAVIDTINELLVEKYNSERITIREHEIVNRYCEKNKISKYQFDRNWLHIEKIFFNAGWWVTVNGVPYTEPEGNTYFFARLPANMACIKID